MQSFRPCFIVGCPRSGTTLLAVTLDRHSKICVPPETHFFHTLPKNWRSWQGKSHEELVDFYVYGNHLWDLKLDRDALLNHFKQHFAPTVPNVYQCALEFFAAPKGKSIICEKTATHLEHIAEIKELFPEAKFIWIVRDGRDVTTSLLAHKWFHNHMFRHAYNWKRLARVGERWHQKIPDEFLRVNFEDFVNDAEATLKRIMPFLGLEYEPSQLNPDVESGAVLGKEMSHKGRALGKIDNKRVGIWQKDLSSDNQAVVNTLLRNELDSLGYTSSKTSLNPLVSLWIRLKTIPLSLAYAPPIYKLLQTISYRLRKS